MGDRLRLLAAAALVAPLLAATPAHADPVVAAPVPQPVVLAGTHVAVRWRNVDDAQVVRVVVRRIDGTLPPASPADGGAVFDGPPAADGALQVVADSVTVGATFTYGFWSFDALGNISVESSHSIKATAPPLLVAPVSASDGGPTTRVALSWSNPDNPTGTPYTVKYWSGPDTGWVIWLLDTTATHAVFGASASPFVPVAGANYRFEVLSQDPYGNDTQHALATVVEPLDTPVTRGWTTLRSARRWAGTVAVARKAGAALTWHVVGSQVTVVADRCPGCGKALLQVDGRTRAVVDTHAATLFVRQQVGSVGHLAQGSHTVRLVVVGTTGHPALQVDGLAVLD
ncbi:hypothetical protein acdb102_29980 [Acidothermaceae bacterium B102]|nr:hypothetical protein acdb102_29980 [Acidothermaceae bacterium B102]